MSHNPGDVNLYGFSFLGADARTKVNNFSIFENLTKPYTTLQATIMDNADLVNTLMGVTDLEVSVSFGQPGQAPYRGTFAVTSVEKGRTMENLRTSTYVITGYSRHMTRFPRVEKAYREMTATDIASDLVNTFLSPDKGLVIGDAARGVLGNQHMPYNINGVQVHKAIRGVLERAVSGKNDSSAYVFFENSKNLVIDTIDSLLDKSLGSPSFKYFQRPMGQDFELDQVRQNFNILSMREESRSDRTSDFQYESQVVNPFDFFSNKNDKTYSGERGAAASIVNLVYNAMRPPTHLSTAAPARARLAAALDGQSLTIHVPLNVEMTVGMGFAVDLIAPMGDTSEAGPSAVSGPLMATEVRHTVKLGATRMQGTSTFKGTRGGR